MLTKDEKNEMMQLKQGGETSCGDNIQPGLRPVLRDGGAVGNMPEAGMQVMISTASELDTNIEGNRIFQYNFPPIDDSMVAKML